MKLTKRVLELAPSATFAMKSRAKALQDQGIQIISLSAGEPDFETPACIIEVAHQALKKGVNHYTATRGTDELIESMQEKLKRDQRANYSAQQVMASVGAKSSISLALDACLESGDEAIILKPYWVTYPELVKLAGAKPVFVEHNLEAIQKAITPKTKLIIINSPNNPGGFVLSRDFLTQLMKMLENTDILLLSDEIYEHLLFDGVKNISPASISEDAYQRTLVVTGASKGYAMTGWRIGITAGPEKIISAMAKLQEQRVSCIPAICQAVAAFAFREPPELQIEIEKMRSSYEYRRDEFLKAISAIPDLNYQKPQGAFYVLLDFNQSYPDDVELTEILLMKAHVATVSGSAFGAPGCIRISLSTRLEDILEATKRISKQLEVLRQV